MGFALIRVVVGCGPCGTCRRIYMYFSVGYERDIRLNTCLCLLPTSAGDSESEGEEEAEKDWENEDVESKEEVGIQA